MFATIIEVTHWRPLRERFEDNIDRDADCWIWTGYTRTSVRTPNIRYGSIWGEGKHHFAHRLAYRFYVGPIPDGLTIDHLCKNTLCVNPAHLEAVTSSVNTLRADTFSGINSRKTHCPQGHPLVWIEKEQRRACPACRNAAKKRYKARKRAERVAVS